MAKKEGTNSKQLWSAVKPFLTNRDVPEGHGVVLEIDGKLQGDKTSVAEALNYYFINIVETTTGKKPRDLLCSSTGKAENTTVDKIFHRYQNHDSINKRIRLSYNETKFSFRQSTRDDILKIINDLESNTAIGLDNIPAKLVKLASDKIPQPLSDLINHTMIFQTQRN